MATITLEVPDELARRLEDIGGRLPDFLTYALDVAGIPGGSMPAERSYLWNEVIEFLASEPSREEILNYKISDVAQDRLEELMYLNREESLTPQEQEELDTFLQLDHLFIMLKAYLRQAGNPQ